MVQVAPVYSTAGAWYTVHCTATWAMVSSAQWWTPVSGSPWWWADTHWILSTLSTHEIAAIYVHLAAVTPHYVTACDKRDECDSGGDCEVKL